MRCIITDSREKYESYAFLPIIRRFGFGRGVQFRAENDGVGHQVKPHQEHDDGAQRSVSRVVIGEIEHVEPETRRQGGGEQPEQERTRELIVRRGRRPVGCIAIDEARSADGRAEHHTHSLQPARPIPAALRSPRSLRRRR